MSTLLTLHTHIHTQCNKDHLTFSIDHYILNRHKEMITVDVDMMVVHCTFRVLL